MRLKTTEQHKKFWSERKIDWTKDYLSTWNHPHRQLISWVLSTFHWVSLWEVGCGPGPNLMKIVKDFKPTMENPRQLGGSDISADAIEVARTTFQGGRFHVEGVEDLLLSDDATDVVLSDATLIYIGPTRIRKTLKEMIRVCRGRIVLCEFNSTSWWKRAVLRFRTGYNAHDYKKLLDELGCYDVQLYKIPPEGWPGSKPGEGWYDFGTIITARV
jgi:ubiquinone/menaquinone biosynthesis C-methylase UbiE